MTELLQVHRLFAADWATARESWRLSDPRLYAVTPPAPVERIMEYTPTPFGALVRSIVHQQVSIASARAIAHRLVAACGGTLDAAGLMRLSDAELQAVGLSRSKIRYVRALAEAEIAGDLADLEQRPDAEIYERLIALPGIGSWTVKTFLMFHAGRVDVFPGEDLGLREAVRVLDGAPAALTPAQTEARAALWSPYRSVAAVSLWDFLRRSRLGLPTGLEALDAIPEPALNAGTTLEENPRALSEA